MSYHEVIYPEFFQASLGAIPALLIASFLNEKFTKLARNTKFGRRFHKLSVNFSIVAIILSLINLLPFEGIQETPELKFVSIGLNLLAVFICLISVGVLGLLHLEEEPEQNEDKSKQLNDSANHSVGSSEDAQQQAIDTPEEDGRKPQKEPSPTGSQNRGEPGTTGGAEERINSKEGTEGSRKPHPRKARKTGPLKRILRASKYLSRQLVQRISNSR